MRPRPARPRSHVLADEAVNHIEAIALRCNFAVQRFNPDYGLDLLVTTVDQDGRVENGWIYIQSRGTERAKRRLDGRISFPVEARHANYWLGEPYPIILVVYEATKRRAYWIHTQPRIRDLHVDLVTRKQVTLLLEPTDVLTEGAFEQIRQLRNAVQAQAANAGMVNA